VLLTGTVEELNDYIEQSGKCLVMDWRSYEGDLLDALAELIPQADLSYQWTAAKDDLYIVYRGRRHKVGLTFSGRDRYITLRRLNEILAGEYELRVFRHTLGDDTHCFYPKPCSWWAEMERAFPAAIERVFARITPDMDFPDYL
jgi:hypothetical protein